jgi:hypothetical protein
MSDEYHRSITRFSHRRILKCLAAIACAFVAAAIAAPGPGVPTPSSATPLASFGTDQLATAPDSASLTDGKSKTETRAEQRTVVELLAFLALGAGVARCWRRMHQANVQRRARQAARFTAPPRGPPLVAAT